VETVEKLAAAFDLEPGDLDPRRLAQLVAEMARTLTQRQAIGRLLTLPEREISAILAVIDERTGKGAREAQTRRRKK
jgi:hypothetical protein